jgi:hypothetical protein
MTGQLSFFAGPRQRGRKPPPAPEFAVHCMVADTLRRWASPGWVWFHPPNGGERPAFVNRHGKRISVEGGRLQRMGARPGVSDFLLVAPAGGRLHALELKRRGDRPDEAQTAFLEAVRAAGGISAWTDSYQGAIEILKGWGALRTRIEVAA